MNTIKEAIYSNNYPLALELINKGESWNLDNFSSSQIYRTLIQKDAYEVLEAFIDKGHISLDVFEYDKFDNTVFSLLTDAKPTEKRNSFLDKILPEVENIDDELMGITWLAYAVREKGSVEFIQKLIDNGCSLNWKSNAGENLLFLTQDIEKSKFLLEQGLGVNTQNAGGNTPIFRAIEKKNKELIGLYAAYGAEMNIQNIKGETPYHKVLFTAVDSSLYELMSGFEPVRLDLRNKNNQSLFFEYVDYCPLSWNEETALLKLLIADGADLFQAENNLYGNELTPAQILARKSFSAFEMLTQQEGFNPNEQDNKGNTWLHYVCSENLNYEQSKAQELYKKVKTLLSLGADPNITNDEDKTPIDVAQDDDLKSKALALMLKK